MMRIYMAIAGARMAILKRNSEVAVEVSAP
jgi:hypothetical protein